ncbi:peroxisome assembly protein 12 [Lethenteron reissneri]|uniref:peroxisome assembly protein 12 n=1 Tax=Lethenteron reissneri TaxID=7753 RepID=UPI002AB6FBD5|nr:peroxisome assembly protein 12 [Lethenteron reissneri]
MAEHGAHLASAATALDGAPSVFEALAQDGLVSAVRPALGHACKVLAESRPALFGQAWRRFDELYLLLDFLLQRHSLLRNSASFSENFYDLKRVPERPGAPAGSRLPRREFFLSLALLVAAPYLRLKVERLVARIREEMDCGIHLPDSRSVKLYRAFLAAFPFVHMTWEGVCLWHQLSYALGRGRHHSPLLRFAGVRLVCRSPLDGAGHEDGPLALPRHHGGVLGALGSLASHAAVNISAAFSVAVFFLQFLESFYALRDVGSSLLGGGGGGGGGGGASSLLLPDLPTPPPPIHLHADAELGDGPAVPPGVCPLCRRRRTNDTALATSGVVLCYPCAYGYVREHGRCPVTGYPTRAQHLVRLYPPEQ